MVVADLDHGWPGWGSPDPGPVDLVWASMALHHLGDPDRTLRELLDAIVPGGSLAAVEFAAPVRVLAEGEALLAPRITRRLIEQFVSQSVAPTAKPNRALETLTEREREVLATVARGLSNAEIATREYVTESTVKTQISSILGKLSLRDRVQLVVYAHDHGLAGARED